MGIIDEIRFRSLPKEERIERIAGALVNGGRKRMASIEVEKLDHGLVQAHRRRVLADEQHAASLVRTPVESDEVRIVNEQLAGAPFYDTKLDPEYMYLVEAAQNFGLPGLPCDFEIPDCHCEPCREETMSRIRDVAVEQFMADYGDPNQDPQDLQERANTLQPTPEEWAKYRAPVEVDF